MMTFKSKSGMYFYPGLTSNRSGTTARMLVSIDLYVDGNLVDGYGPMMPFLRRMIPFMKNGAKIPLPPGLHHLLVRQESRDGTQGLVETDLEIPADEWVDVFCRGRGKGKITSKNLLNSLEVD